MQIYDEVILEAKKKFSTPISILEIGVQAGGSLEIWRSINGFAFDDFTARINLSPKNFEPIDDDK